MSYLDEAYTMETIPIIPAITANWDNREKYKQYCLLKGRFADSGRILIFFMESGADSEAEAEAAGCLKRDMANDIYYSLK
jgi:hypothetical protein